MTAKILVLDIETSPNLAYVWGLFKQDIALSQIEMVGQVISFAYRWHGEKQIGFHSDFHDGHGIMLDRAHSLMSEADVIVHWNGTSFDMPHLNRELVLGGYEPPAPYKQVDLCLVVRKQFRFTSNKLDHVAQQLNVGAKTTHSGFTLWRKCMEGDAAAWDLMRKYNKRDVEITDRVYGRLKPWVPTHPHLALFGGDPEKCGRCAGKLQKRGFATTSLGVYQRFQCTSCGGWTRGGKRVEGLDTRPM